MAKDLDDEMCRLIQRLYVALTERHVMECQEYGINHSAPPTVEDARRMLEEV